MLIPMTALAQAFATTRVRLLGGEVDPITPAEMLAATEAFVAGGGTAVIANHNSHSLFLLPRTPALKAFFAEADLVQIDSKPMILWAKLMGLPVGGQHRSTYLDWREAFWARVRDRGWRVFHVGGAPGVGERGAAEIRKRWPGVQLAEHCGYFDIDPRSADSVRLRQDIAAFDPDIILVGMGMPRQETWIAANRDLIGRGVFFPVGAAFDYEAGVQDAAPRWTGKLGVEWLFRLFSQPRRLAFRYLVEPWFLAPAAFADIGARLGRR
ncbi:MAG TPA: WecB/TagA/CpsF family glycosyltransferase [Caulobacter sp.]|nr:WecB/TagA/CpsF family glycosyltransferase [Caulobacter sp.]